MFLELFQSFILFIVYILLFRAVSLISTFLAKLTFSRKNGSSLSSYHELRASMNLIIFCFVHFPFVIIFSIIYNVLTIFSIFNVSSLVEYLSQGLLLGIGEVSISFVLVWFAMSLIGEKRREIFGFYRKGWMKIFITAKDNLKYLFFLPSFLIIFTEELFFRGIIFFTLIRVNEIIAIVYSTILFMLLQIIGTKPLISSLPAVLGAFVIGVVHAYYVMVERNIIPLIIAHYVFFTLFVILNIKKGD